MEIASTVTKKRSAAPWNKNHTLLGRCELLDLIGPSVMNLIRTTLIDFRLRLKRRIGLAR